MSLEEGDGIEVIAPAETAEVNFTDIAGHWAEDYINQAASKGWVRKAVEE